jgi:hypothetical protein
MKIIYGITMIYGLAFIIGMIVAGIIWLIYNFVKYEGFDKYRNREHYLDMRRFKLNGKKNKA